jgi:hypothetical protein
MISGSPIPVSSHLIAKVSEAVEALASDGPLPVAIALEACA